MHLYLRAGIGFAALAVGLVTLRPARAQIINGSFENTQGTFVNQGSNFMTLAPGSTVIPGWTVTNDQIAWLTTPNVGIAPSDGSFFLDLTGTHDNGFFGGVTQTVNTTPGGSYTLGFDLGSFENSGSFRGPVSLNVQAGAISQNFTFTPAPGSTELNGKTSQQASSPPARLRVLRSLVRLPQAAHIWAWIM
jgi:hypothetical protein